MDEQDEVRWLLDISASDDLSSAVRWAIDPALLARSPEDSDEIPPSLAEQGDCMSLISCSNLLRTTSMLSEASMGLQPLLDRGLVKVHVTSPDNVELLFLNRWRSKQAESP
jgi:hypothetical protein